MSLNTLNQNQFYNEQRTLAQSGGDEHSGYRPRTSNIYQPNFANGAQSEINPNPSSASAYDQESQY